MLSIQSFWNWYIGLFHSSDNNIVIGVWSATVTTVGLLIGIVPLLRKKSRDKWKTPYQTFGRGGKGGDSIVSGDYGAAYGGGGGHGGPGATGGDGGSASVYGNHGLAVGGEAGKGGEPWPMDGSSFPGMKKKDRKMMDDVLPFAFLYNQLQQEYFREMNIETNTNSRIPDEWINKRLKKLKVPYRIKSNEGGGYQMLPR